MLSYFNRRIAVLLAALLTALALVAAATFASAATIVDVNPGDDLDAKVNSAPIGALIQVHASATATNASPTVYNLSTPLALKDNQSIVGDAAGTATKGPATYALPKIRVQRASGSTQGTLAKVGGAGQSLKWLSLNATNLNNATMTNNTADQNLSMQYIEVYGAQGSCISQTIGKFLNSYVHGCGTDSVGHDGTVAGIKFNFQGEVGSSYFVNNPGNAVWCDVGCQSESNFATNGWYVHDNVVENSGRHGIFDENNPKPSINWGDDTKALIQNNYVYGNTKSEISVSDAQKGTVDSNIIGKSPSGVIDKSPSGVGIELHSSGDPTRGIQKDAVVNNNQLNGLLIKGTGTDRDGTPNTGCGDNGNVCSDSPPPTDADSDGVPDASDLCPGTPAGTPVDADGCPITNPTVTTLVGAGDIASSNTNDTLTANTIKSIPSVDKVFTLGDNAYNSGTATEFTNYYNPTWGLFKSNTRPAPGNHDYATSGAAPYYNYFGTLAGTGQNGWYAYDVGNVHLVSLNSMCNNEGGCGATSPMNTFLKNDLASDTHVCEIAYWHHPVASSSSRVSQTANGIDWTTGVESYKIADAAGVDLILNGHEHYYERFGNMSISGSSIVPDSAGPVEVIAGTGGRGQETFGVLHSGSVKRGNTSFGVLKLTVDGASIHGEFVHSTGSFTDSFDIPCAN